MCNPIEIPLWLCVAERKTHIYISLHISNNITCMFDIITIHKCNDFPFHEYFIFVEFGLNTKGVAPGLPYCIFFCTRRVVNASAIPLPQWPAAKSCERESALAVDLGTVLVRRSSKDIILGLRFGLSDIALQMRQTAETASLARKGIPCASQERLGIYRRQAMAIMALFGTIL